MQIESGETRIGVLLYWIVVYAFAILFGGLAEEGAGFVSKLPFGFATGNLSVHSVLDVGKVVCAVALFLAIVTAALVGGDHLLGERLAKESKLFKTFSLAFVFLGSHIFYDLAVYIHTGQVPK